MSQELIFVQKNDGKNVAYKACRDVVVSGHLPDVSSLFPASGGTR